MTHVAGMLLLYLPSEFDAFVCFSNLIDRHLWRALYSMDLTQLEPHLRLYAQLLSSHVPDVYAHFVRLDIGGHYLLDWLLTLFGKPMQHRACCAVWDLYLLEGEIALYRVAVAILALHRQRLLSSDIEGVHRLLKTLVRLFLPYLHG